MPDHSLSRMMTCVGVEAGVAFVSEHRFVHPEP
jgi:hypothetical protein